jgi:hypothetical protein
MYNIQLCCIIKKKYSGSPAENQKRPQRGTNKTVINILQEAHHTLDRLQSSVEHFRHIATQKINPRQGNITTSKTVLYDIRHRSKPNTIIPHSQDDI